MTPPPGRTDSTSKQDAGTYREGPIDGVEFRPVAIYEDDRGWLAELFRSDELPDDLLPAMAYVSATNPGVARGPHEHQEQTDLFAFIGPGDFLVRLWDARPGSTTFGNTLSRVVGATDPQALIVPPGVVHGYKNVSPQPGWVFNAPNRLYRGVGRQGPVDEIRHEQHAASIYRL